MKPLQLSHYDPKESRLTREVYAEALKAAELELRTAQAEFARDDSDANRDRYAQALFDYDRLQGMFPFVAVGAGEDVV